MGANEPRGVASLDPSGLIGSINVGDHYTLLHNKYISSWPHGLRAEVFFFYIFSHYKSMGANDPRARQIWTPGAWVAGDYLTSLHT